MKNKWIFGAFALIIAAACGKDSEEILTPEPTFYEEVLVQDFEADTANKFRYTFFSFIDGKAIDSQDSATTKWDIAFQATTIRVNSGASGPGSVEGQIIDGLFDEINSIPTEGFNTDGEQTLALSGGSGNGWYTYNQESHVLNASPGKLLLFKLNAKTMVKMEIISYYLGAPANPTLENVSRFYTFRYKIINQ